MANGNDNVANIVLEHLRALRADNQALRADNADFKHRLTNLEESTANGFSAVLRNGAKNVASLNRRFDRLDERVDRLSVRFDHLDDRVERIERGLERSDA